MGRVYVHDLSLFLCLVMDLPNSPSKGGFNSYLEVAETRLQNPHLRKQNATVLKYFKKPSSIVSGSSNEDFLTIEKCPQGR